MMASNPGARGIEAIVFRTFGDPVSLWESLLREEVLRLPAELARVDALLDDPAFFAPFAGFFSLTAGRPSTPMECYLRMMFLKFLTYRRPASFQVEVARTRPADPGVAQAVAHVLDCAIHPVEQCCG
jgi:transposase, IS5 family